MFSFKTFRVQKMLLLIGTVCLTFNLAVSGDGHLNLQNKGNNFNRNDTIEVLWQNEEQARLFTIR